MSPAPDYVPAHGLLAGKKVLVTAAAGTGIGFAAAKKAKEEGATVVVSDKHERRCAESAAELGVVGIPCDVGTVAAEEGFADPGQLLEAYLVPGAPAYRRRRFPTVAEAIDLVHAAGGVAVWAHPFWDIDADPAVLEAIDRFAAQGLDGVEVFYVTHTPEQVALLDDHCRAKGLLTTGSSDFHGPEHRLFHRFRAHELHGRTPDLGPLAG